jgi:hypothetical protein
MSGWDHPFSPNLVLPKRPKPAPAPDDKVRIEFPDRFASADDLDAIRRDHPGARVNVMETRLYGDDLLEPVLASYVLVTPGNG